MPIYLLSSANGPIIPLLFKNKTQQGGQMENLGTPVDEYYSDDFTMAATIVKFKYTNFDSANSSIYPKRQLFQLTLKDKNTGIANYIYDTELFGLLGQAMQFVGVEDCNAPVATVPPYTAL